MSNYPLFSLLSVAAMVVPAGGNEALDYIDGVQGSSNWVSYTPYPGSVSSSAKAKSKVVRKFDYSERWPLSVPPVVTPYRNQDNPYVQEFSVTGLLEWRWEDTSFDVKAGEPRRGVRGTGVRRARLGAMVKAFYNTEVEVSALVDGDGDYEGIDKLQATVDLSDKVAVRMGKFRPPFSLEYSQDPSVRWTPEMSALNRQIVPGNSLGVLFAGAGEHWDWGLGYFGGDLDKNLPGIGSNGYLLGKLAYTTQGSSEANPQGSFQRLHLDYIYNFETESSQAIPLAYRHLFAAGVQISSGNLDFLSDFMLADGDNAEAWGATLLGAYWLVEDAIRLVGRYHYASSSDEDNLAVFYGVPDGVTDTLGPLFGVPGGGVVIGNQLHSFYGGLNYHLLEDNLILSTGIEYQLLKSAMNEDFKLDSFTWQFGGRLAF